MVVGGLSGLLICTTLFFLFRKCYLVKKSGIPYQGHVNTNDVSVNVTISRENPTTYGAVEATSASQTLLSNSE